LELRKQTRKPQFEQIIEAIDRYGARNISHLARATRIPTETVRYKVGKQFRRFGLGLDVLVNERKLGLQKFLVEFGIPSSSDENRDNGTKGRKVNEQRLLRALHENAYLHRAVRDLVTRTYFASFLVHPSVQGDWRSFLDSLQDEGVMQNFDVSAANWSRSLSINPRFVNFKTGAWNVDWDKLAREKKNPPSYEVDRIVKVPKDEYDTYDMEILRELQRDVTQALSDMSNKLKINKKTLSYHYRKHVKNVTAGYFVRWLGSNSHGQDRGDILAKFTFKNVGADGIKELRRVFTLLPFTSSEDVYSNTGYSAEAVVPGRYFAACLRFLGTAFSGYVPKMDLALLDRRTEVRYPVPFSLFKDREGWVFDGKSALAETVKEAAGKPGSAGRKRRRK
jgi:DNA-binding Lrp family transcriptional regulator